MDTWGPGNFDRDDAFAYTNKAIDGFAETVEQLFAEGRASLDEEGEGRFTPTGATCSRSPTSSLPSIA